jgi:hypothetical protein
LSGAPVGPSVLARDLQHAILNTVTRLHGCQRRRMRANTTHVNQILSDAGAGMNSMKLIATM